MTDLTEKWKNGELPDGFYYFKLPDGSTDIASEYKMIRYRLTKDADKVEVLAPVPSYDHFVELTEKVKENQQLKELLLSSRGFVDKERITLETSGFGHNEYCRRTKELLTDIDNVIGEKK